MDSGNSGSMQSSSGGDEEYDSRTESISALLNSSGHVGAMSNPQPQPPPHHHHHHNHPSSLFDPLNYLDSFSRSTPPPNANSLLNLDMVWPRGLRSEPNCTEIGALIGSSSMSGVQRTGQAPLPSPSSMSLPTGPENGARASTSTPSDQTNAVRNSKKRSRASRRAPTTVLTTDTSNFRAMVQEFTGIPAPPFSASPFPRSRLDFFNTASTMRSSHLEPPPPPYLLRPFPQKVQPPSLIDAIASTTTNTAATTAGATTTSNSTSTNNYQLPSELGFLKQPQNLLNMQNPILPFQSPPPPPKYPLANVPIFMTTKSQGSITIPSSDSHLKMGMLEDFGINHGGLPNLVTSDRMQLRSDDNSSNWGDRVGSINDGDQSHLRSFNGNYGNSQRVNSCKMNYSGSSSDFHAEKGSENVSSRGEGMVDSWICSSD